MYGLLPVQLWYVSLQKWIFGSLKFHSILPLLQKQQERRVIPLKVRIKKSSLQSNPLVKTKPNNLLQKKIIKDRSDLQKTSHMKQPTPKPHIPRVRSKSRFNTSKKNHQQIYRCYKIIQMQQKWKTNYMPKHNQEKDKEVLFKISYVPHWNCFVKCCTIFRKLLKFLTFIKLKFSKSRKKPYLYLAFFPKLLTF